MKKLTSFAAIAALCALATSLAAAVPASKANDAFHILSNQTRYSAADVGWASTTLKTFIAEHPDPAAPAPVPAPTPAPTPTPAPPPVPGPTTGTIAIANQAALDKALATAKGGEELRLAVGSYALTLSGKTFAAPVVIRSVDPAKRAKFSQIKLTSVVKMSFAGLEIARGSTVAARESTFLVNISGGSDLTFDGNHIHGSLDGDPSNDGVGIKAWSTRLTITNNEFEQLGRGAVLGGDVVTIRGNVLHDMRSEGFQSSNIRDLTIAGNLFRDWDRDEGDHPDAIQIFTAGTTRASARIAIRDNVILANKEGMQGIFLRDEGLKLPFDKVTIENNFMLGANMANGIYVDNGRDVTVRNNTVVSPIDDANPVWISLKNVTGLVKSGNIADSGGEKTPAQAFSAAQMALLKVAVVARVTPAALVVPGVGYQPR